jgi:hypothetical protein
MRVSVIVVPPVASTLFGSLHVGALLAHATVIARMANR